MNELQDTLTLLAQALHENPVTALATVVTWLDPLWQENTGERVYVDEAESELHYGLSITRFAFPDIYTSTIERMRAGGSELDLERFICQEITHRGIPLDTLEWMSAGIPLDCHGIDLEELELYDRYPALIPILGLFGIEINADDIVDDATMDVDQDVYRAASVIVNSLYDQQDESLKQVGWALSWVFGCSGNTLIDFTNEAMGEWEQQLNWDKDDITFAIAMIEEAGAILDDANRGLDLLKANAGLFQELAANVKRVLKAVAKMKGSQNAPNIRLEWTLVVAGAGGATVNDPQFLQFRGDAA